MQNLLLNDSTYQTISTRAGGSESWFPSLRFYPRFLSVVCQSAIFAKRGKYTNEVWQKHSIKVLRALEKVGVDIGVTGLEHAKAVDGPVIFVGNHLSVMETVVLPSWILSHKPFTYVIKQSLLEVPIFKHVMSSLDPIAVTRTNPRLDLKIVLEQGVERVKQGLSIMVFPQTTRTPFNPEQFSTIGVKLARKAGVPIIPLALRTDAWQNGKIAKDFGKIVPSRKVFFAFGEPLVVTGKGSEEQLKIIDFIETSLAAWE
ncbi:MAG: 1-acyl-sn-glycerol-3-phosphate acyltransferase [Desulfofustis sp.]|nr:1-acyl-sn-glycerol-3-phosphate acyltransferase [Desulfofustis sp.]NNK57319.1 1-acyl-sn-glycerol-3-phosphate acyltransferase [Desulfofustis sp.]RZW22519.1 MAG: 1-acyl-sn-glycerol-3-phosphate acyltransferase [Desulfobulbaceae bacterium]